MPWFRLYDSVATWEAKAKRHQHQSGFQVIAPEWADRLYGYIGGILRANECCSPPEACPITSIF